jgi:hypothetical protein
MHQATIGIPEPHSAGHGIYRQAPRRSTTADLRPWNLLDLALRRQSQETGLAVRDPQVAVLVLGEGIDVATPHAIDVNVGSVLDVAESRHRSDPDASVAILE